jgi:hypothetical protein
MQLINEVKVMVDLEHEIYALKKSLYVMYW